MPRQIATLPDDLILRELDKLSPSICITAHQAAMVLGVSVPQLEERRRAGAPPPFISDGDRRGKVRYTVGAIRDHIRQFTHLNTAQAHRRQTTRQSGFAFASESDFLVHAKAADHWTFALVGKAQRPVALFQSLSLNLDDEIPYEELTLQEFADRLGTSIQMELADVDRRKLDGALPGGSATCSECGATLNGPHRCIRM